MISNHTKPCHVQMAAVCKRVSS